MTPFFPHCRGSGPKISMSAVDNFGHAVAQATATVNPYHPILKKTLTDSRIESQEEGDFSIVVGGTSEETARLSREFDAAVVHFSHQLSGPIKLAELLGEGRVFCLGARDYLLEEEHTLRYNQRLIAGHELPLHEAALAVANELHGQPVVLSLELNLLSCAYLPDLVSAPLLGEDPAGLLAALEGLSSLQIKALHLWGGEEYPIALGRTSRAGAEILRHCILSFWA